MSEFVNLAADYGWGPETLLLIFILVVIVSVIGFLIVTYTTKSKLNQSFKSKRKYHFETYWAIGTAGILIWLWIISYPWMPPVAFSPVINQEDTADIQIVNITAGQWFWIMSLGGKDKAVKENLHPSFSHVVVEAEKPVKFIAHSLDVNHGFGIFSGPSDGAPILLQMQVVPDLENIFYYTFKNPGFYQIRCLEYCGYAHPYMTGVIEVISPIDSSEVNSTLLQINSGGQNV